MAAMRRRRDLGQWLARGDARGAASFERDRKERQHKSQRGGGQPPRNDHASILTHARL